ncbi:MAG: S41 family peptidase [Balneolaceae bacterium]|jgi:Tol biopolymer transport system component/C-terminal processing protease CtpA/Prc
MKYHILLLFLCFPILVFSQKSKNPIWAGHPAISPDGQWIVFEYKGDIFKVPASGGNATALTLTPSYEGYPVWSHHGDKIAFASDRHGNFDAFVMSSEGGMATRLTYNSASDIPSNFSTDDKNVIFSTTRKDIYTSVRFPIPSLFMKLYSVPAKGGRSIMINSAGTQHANYNENGKTIIFQDRKGYESEQRKHERASVTRDIWAFNFENNQYTQLTHFQGNDMEPVWGSDDSYYYLSERNDDNLNVYRASLSNPNQPEQLTRFKNNPVRGLSRSTDGTLCFTQGGAIYTMLPGQQPQKVNITIQGDFAQQATQTLSVANEHISEMALSPSGKEVAFVYRGDIFATSADGKTTKRLTNTPYQERMIEFSPDGRSILYSVERDDSWNIDRVDIADENEPYFYASTIVNKTPVIATDKTEFQPRYSPDGTKIAYLEERNILKVYDIDSRKTVTVIPEGINYSYSDGDQYFTWSPDSKWLLAQSNEGTFIRAEVDLIKADGSGERHNITKSGFNDWLPKWGMNGKMMAWVSDREGMKNLSRGSQGDVYAVFFDQKAFDRFNLSKEDFDLLTEKEKKDSTETKEAEKEKEKEKPLTLNLDNLESRTKRLTINSSLLSDFVLSKDGEKLFYLAKYEEGYDLWQTEPRTHETKVLANLDAPGGGSLAIDKDGKSIFVLAGGSIRKVELSDGKAQPLSINANIDWDPAGERAYILDHAWRQVKKKLFDPNLQGVDWNYYYNYYKEFLPSINNDRDFCTALSEFLGELNVSHTGCYYHPDYKNPDETASLGMIYDQTKGGNGLVVQNIITGGPMDNADSNVKRGDILQKIDGIQITDGFDWSKLLNHKAGAFTRLTFYDPRSKETWDEVIKPIPPEKEHSLMYDRWVKTMQEMTDSLSDGQIGYVHVQSMNDPSYRNVFGKVLGENFNKKALIVDTRFNGGGWLHDHLVTFLDGKLYMEFAPQGNIVPGGESTDKWNKPSCVLMSESNYSDAFMFPYIYKKLGIGKLIGMPVPGTGTAVWWERQINPTLTFGIPMVATKGINEEHFTENHQLEPDIKVDNSYHKVLSGEDAQLETAVKEMLKETKGSK